MTEKVKDAMKISMGTFIQLGSILAITILSFALVKGQANFNSVSISEHKILDDKKWDLQRETDSSIKDDIDQIRLVQTEIRLSQREAITHYNHIIDSIEELKNEVRDFKNKFEVVE